jgi:hypothetical protein
MYRNLDPISSYDAYSADEYLAQQRWQLIADEMYNMRHDAMERIDTIIHPEYAEEFIKMLCKGYNYNEEHAENIAKKLSLTPAHIYALMGDEKEFTKLVDTSRFRHEKHEMDFADYV